MCGLAISSSYGPSRPLRTCHAGFIIGLFLDDCSSTIAIVSAREIEHSVLPVKRFLSKTTDICAACHHHGSSALIEV